MDKLLAEHNLTTLRGNDQLVQARAAGGAFGGFEEGWLGGAPFYGGYGLLTVNGVASHGP